MSQSYPLSLSSLTEREAIIDTLYRAVIASDRHDLELFTSAWAGEDVVFEIHDNEKRVIPNLSLIRTYIFDRIGPMDTTHNISMVRVDVKEGADTAALTCTTLAQHSPPGRGREPDGPKYTVGGQYSLDLIKNAAGEWKVKKWVLNVIWDQGDASVMKGPA
jgi:ketosteroid isomerase-like protein